MHDADLSLRVLRACNSAAAGIAQEVTSVQQAVILLGPRQLHRLATLAIAQGLGVQPEQRLTQIIEYAMLTDLVGVRHAVAAGTGFLAGLVLEVAEDLETPLETLIKDLPLAPDLARALRDRQGTLGSALDVVAAYKKGTTHPAASMTDIANLHGQAVLAAAGVITMAGDADATVPKPQLPPVRHPNATEPAAPAAAAAEALADEASTVFGAPPTPAEAARAEQWHGWEQQQSPTVVH
jgi:EAL and modified HD-GYP domain-containing signal transduction protein